MPLRIEIELATLRREEGKAWNYASRELQRNGKTKDWLAACRIADNLTQLIKELEEYYDRK